LAPTRRVQLGTPAARFSLVDQFGRVEHLADFRGTVVLLTFIDAKCTRLCALTGDLLRFAVKSLGGDPPVQLLAINANARHKCQRKGHLGCRRPSVVDQHRMLHQWLFLTGSRRQIARVWASYGIRVVLKQGDIEHTGVILIIDASGRQRAVFPIASRTGIADEAEALAETVRRVA
jgi:cytochrome oxidase Cu insertion factor (SCO1/SenC/PrrC family)